MKRFDLLLIGALLCAPAYAERTVSYARANQNVTLNLDWQAGNYGDITWQYSDDGGSSWIDVQGADTPSLTFKASKPVSLYRAVINGDPSCPPIIHEREIKAVDVQSEVVAQGGHSVQLEISGLDLQGAEIVEYGYTAAFGGVGRNYSILPRFKTGDALPDEETFTIECSGLNPSTQYTIRPYFKTADGSLIFGAGKVANTLDGLTFDTEDWIIEKDALQIPFSIPGFTGGNPHLEVWFGKDDSSLSQVDFESTGNNTYRSKLIEGLTPATDYLVVVKGEIGGEETEIRKTVRTWTDYSDITVDETVKPVRHIVEWDSEKKLVCLTPETLQVEYPRMCRVDDNKILLTYHGGASDHWQNSYLRKSYDNGKTWTDPVTIYTASGSFLGSGYNRICTPEMTKLKNGWIILTVVANGNPETNNNCITLSAFSPG